MGRPKKEDSMDVRFELRLTKKDLEKLDALAKEIGVSRSECVRIMINYPGHFITK